MISALIRIGDYDFVKHYDKLPYHNGHVVLKEKLTPICLLPVCSGRVTSGVVQTSPGWHYPHIYATLSCLSPDRLINVDILYDFEEWNNRYIPNYEINTSNLPLGRVKIVLKNNTRT